MEPYLFTGVVIPERAHLNLDVAFQAKVSGSDEPVKIRLSILLNKIAIYVYTENSFNVYDLRNIVKSIAKTQVAAVGVLLGRYYEIQIDRVISLERGVNYVFEIEIPVIHERKNYQDSDWKFTDEFAADHRRVMNALSGERGVFIHRCLNDLTAAMVDAEDTGFYCYRAIESLMQHCSEHFGIYGDKTSDKEKKWQKFREFSETQKDQIMSIKSYADPLRHGRAIDMSGGERGDLFKKTWDIFDRYIARYSSLAADE